MHPSRASVVLVDYSPTGDVSGAYRTGVFRSRAWIWMYMGIYMSGDCMFLVCLKSVIVVTVDFKYIIYNILYHIV